MPCFQPMRARQTETGVLLGNSGPPDAAWINLPCGKCLGCRLTAARNWAIRCQLELQQHNGAAFVTLTYDEQHKPPTLSKRDLQLWLKRIRRHTPDRTLRFFACGEYGETNRRPHYHAILYGITATQRQLVDDTWGLGRTQTENATPANIAYTAGYTAKKAGLTCDTTTERVDPETGEVYNYQKPFIQMSRRPGIGGHARQWPASWRQFAIHNGHKVPVPRFLHEAWKAQATEEQLQQLQEEKEQIANARNTRINQLEEEEKLAEAKNRLRQERRKL